MTATEITSGLHIGDSRHFDAHSQCFRVKKCDRSTWALFCQGVTRCRFGTLDQIRGDIEHALYFGTLPGQAGRP